MARGSVMLDQWRIDFKNRSHDNQVTVVNQSTHSFFALGHLSLQSVTPWIHKDS